MIIFEVVLGFLTFKLIEDVVTRIALICMMLIGIIISTIMYEMYKDERKDNYETYKKNLL